MLALMVAAAVVASGGSPGQSPCPEANLVNRPPAEMLDREDDFRAHLSTTDQARLAQVLPRDADGGIAQCAGKDGAACDVKAYLDAFNATGLMPRFLATLCPKP